jgi:hypothetical protein
MCHCVRPRAALRMCCSVSRMSRSALRMCCSVSRMSRSAAKESIRRTGMLQLELPHFLHLTAHEVTVLHL